MHYFRKCKLTYSGRKHSDFLRTENKAWRGPGGSDSDGYRKLLEVNDVLF